MPGKIWKTEVVSKRVLYNVMRYAVAATLLITSIECTTVKLKDHWDRYYDPKYGTEEEDIRKHFNLHRGRWWNYYDRGSVYLAYGHYEKARADFDKAAAKRSRDKWDARTYGMHFIDYFPNRESGVTYYFIGEQETDMTVKEERFKDAIRKLETSLRQEESSRAKFYLNQARRLLLQVTKEKDKIPPTIHVKKPIYTNQRTVRFDVTVTDQDSYVEDIRIGSSRGDVRIDRPKLFVELAEKEVKGTAELTIGPQDKYAVVTITASDLAGNESDPNSALIIVDTQSPTASVAIVGDKTQPDSPVRVFIEAMDDFGLKQIQAGDDPNNKVECDGAMQYSGTIAGMPRGGELPITVVDNAGNAVVTSIPIEEDTGRARLARASWPQTPRRLTLSNEAGTRNWNRPLSPTYLPAMNVLQPGSSIHRYQRGYRTASLAVFRASAAEGTGNGQLKFDLPPHVLQLGGKETSQNFFYFDGTLCNAESVKKIEVNVSYQIDGEEKDNKHKIDTSQTQTISERQNIVFSQKVDLTDAPVDKPIEIKVEAYCQQDAAEPCAEENLMITKRDDCSLKSNAVYGILLLPLRSDVIASELSAEDISMLRHIYDVFLKSLRELHMYDQESDKSSKRFNIYDVNEVDKASENTEWYTLKEKDYFLKMSKVFQELQSRQASGETGEPRPSVIDLVIDGNIMLSRINGEKRFEVMLRAIDVSTTKLIRFPGIGTEDITVILADVYGRTKDLKWYTDLLAFKVGERFPRLQANITRIDDKKRIVEIDCGKRNRLFPKMKLLFYRNMGEPGRNGFLEQKGPGEIIDLDWYSCKIRPEYSPGQVANHDIVITK